MFTRIAFLFVLLQCGSPQNLAQKLQPDASYTKYVPGAGGGVGITFKVSFEANTETAEFKTMVVNGDTLEAAIIRVDPMAIEANKFYPYPEDSEGNPPPSWSAPLYEAEEYNAELYFLVGGEKHKIIVTEFAQKRGPLYQ